MNIINRICLLLAPAMFVVVLSGCVSRAQIEISSDDEFQRMRTSMPLSNNLTDRAYVRCVALSIIAQLDEPYVSYDWEIELFDSQDVNAFAMAGGKIGVLTGLLDVATNQDQLAAVLGHEVAHVTEDHTLERANRDVLVRNTAIFGSEVLDASTGLETTDIMVFGAQVGLMLPYQRSAESEADTVGLVYMSAAGFDPRASITLWTNMEKASGGAGPPPWLSTHPSGDARIAELAGEMIEVLPLYNKALEEGRRPNCRN
jgi:predicted Zn-dependent protease